LLIQQENLFENLNKFSFSHLPRYLQKGNTYTRLAMSPTNRTVTSEQVNAVVVDACSQSNHSVFSPMTVLPLASAATAIVVETDETVLIEPVESEAALTDVNRASKRVTIK
jgi:hypothetical protein